MIQRLKPLTILGLVLALSPLASCRQREESTPEAAEAPPTIQAKVKLCDTMALRNFWDTRLLCLVRQRFSTGEFLDHYELSSVSLDTMLDIPVMRAFTGMMKNARQHDLKLSHHHIYLGFASRTNPERVSRAVLVVDPSLQLTYKGICDVYLDDIQMKVVSTSSKDLPGFEDTLKVIINRDIWPKAKPSLIKKVRIHLSHLIEKNRYCRFVNTMLRKDKVVPAPSDTSPAATAKSAKEGVQSHPLDDGAFVEAGLEPPPGYPESDASLDQKKAQTEQILAKDPSLTGLPVEED